MTKLAAALDPEYCTQCERLRRERDNARDLAAALEEECANSRNPDVPSFAGACDSLGVSFADLDRWEALAAAATPGPWERDITGHTAFVKQSGVDDQYVVLGGARRLDVDCEFIATSRTAVAALVAALREALETNARLNRRSQIAEAAIADLTREPVGGRKHRSVAAEVWERCEESHGLACRTTSRARGTAVALEAENARLTEALYLTRITLEATFRVLQEASGLPDDIDDPDCRDEMVLALRPRAEKAEAENARLREGIERLATEMQRGRLIPGTPVFGCAACGMPNESEACEDHDEGLQHAGDMLRALLAEGGE